MPSRKKSARIRNQSEVGRVQLDLAGYPEYLKPISAELGQQYRYSAEIARGKTGLACKLQSIKNTSHFLCLKTISPDVSDPVQRDRVRKTLANEVDILSPLQHRCLPTVYASNMDADIPYYVCTFHPGQTWATFRSDANRLPFPASVYCIWSLFDVLRYLHSKVRTHSDLHDKNVMISSSVFQDGIMIIDLSSGHRASDSSPNTPHTGMVQIKSLNDMASRGSTASRDEVIAAGQRSDFVALGQLLAVMNEVFFAQESSLTRNMFLEFCHELQAGRLRDWDEIQRRFMVVIDPFRCITENAKLFLSKRGKPLKIPIPVNRYVQVGEVPLQIVNTEAFQKLRGIKQLSFCDWYFPGATHTRFEHSLGVFQMSQLAIKELVFDSEFRRSVDPIQTRGFMLAALLHDIGHYPYAHVIEQYAASRFSDNEEIQKASSHHQHSLNLLENDNELHGKILQHWGEEAFHWARKTLLGQAGTLSEMLDGTIDIDKIDYLSRDALHCGVQFGQGLDIESLLSSYRASANGGDLLLHESGIAAAEGFVILQDQMLSSVYWHEAVSRFSGNWTIVEFHKRLQSVVATRSIVRFFEAWAVYQSDVRSNRSGASIARPTPRRIVLMSRTGVSLGRLLASRAGLRFAR